MKEFDAVFGGSEPVFRQPEQPLDEPYIEDEPISEELKLREEDVLVDVMDLDNDYFTDELLTVPAIKKAFRELVAFKTFEGSAQNQPVWVVTNRANQLNDFQTVVEDHIKTLPWFQKMVEENIE